MQFQEASNSTNGTFYSDLGNLCQLYKMGHCTDSPAAVFLAKREKRGLSDTVTYTCDKIPVIATTDDGKELYFKHIYSNLPRPLRLKIGHQLTDTITRCAMNGKADCNNSDSFRTFSSFKYGNCFAFNDYASKTPNIKVTRTGEK